jgi:KipI family sensor histidine kinase inhibitor
VGWSAALVEVDSGDEVRAVYRGLADLRRAGGLPRDTELVPAARTVLVRADGDRVPDLAGLLTRLLAGIGEPAVPARVGPPVLVPVRYDGPDLDEVARLAGLSAAEVVRRHTAAELAVAFCGFAPGFGYLTGLPAELQVPRRPSPRTTVEAGSVGLAGEFTGVYPRRSPGGWQLIGRTDVVLWDPDRDPPALFTPGTQVRFTVSSSP